MESIRYIKGDATNPKDHGQKIIAHICNDIGAWGRGFVLALSKKWKAPEIEYKLWHKSRLNFGLGKVQFIRVETDVLIANMIGQENIRIINGQAPIRYESVEACLECVAEFAILNQMSVHMPRIGCGLAGGKWPDIEEIIKKTLLCKDIKVTVYDFE